MAKPKPRKKQRQEKQQSTQTKSAPQIQNGQAENVPMMFRAQVTPRCNLQRIDPDRTKKKQKQDVEIWANEWKKALPNPVSSSQDQSQSAEDNLPAWRRKTVQPKPQVSLRSPSDFGEDVKKESYTLDWRLANNSGADPSINRPAFGTHGYPFYTGSSMKGAFRRACTPKQEKRYCGGQSGNEMKPSEVGLRFHGGYPVDETWREKIIDLVHPQEQKQVTDPTGNRSNAMAQVTFYQCEMKFGISSAQKLDDQEWQEIWSIWENALERGLGGRTSAGYGYFKQYVPEKTLLTVSLFGQGVASKMLDRKKEFRPNMFKAALRGHTLRLFAGLTDRKNAQRLTKKLWGGFGNKNPGLLAVIFEMMKLEFPIPDGNEPTYKVSGKLKLLVTDPNHGEKELKRLESIATKLVQFAMLFGGFGKSWRRVDHSKFKPDYPKKKDGHQIGCHWKFGAKSSDLYLQLGQQGDLKAIAQFINNLRQELKQWGNICDDDKPELNYREAWHKDKAEVWGRISAGEPGKASQAIEWLHHEKVKEKLGGSTRHTGRIWHRMYPYAIVVDGELKTYSKKFIELLVLFPDKKYQDSYNFLVQEMRDKSSLFEKIW